MIQIQEGNLTVRYSEHIPYTWVMISGFVTTDQYLEALSSQKLFDLIVEKQVRNVLLDLGRTERIGTDELAWITGTWLARMAISGVRRVSVVVVRMAHDLLRGYFDAVEAQSQGKGLQVRFFYDNQFYDGWKAVAWFT